MSSHANCIELIPGGNIQINTESKESGPPEGFVDNTVQCGRLRPDGTIEYYGTMPAFPEGKDLTKADTTFTGDRKVNKEVSNLDGERRNWAELWPQIEKMQADGMSGGQIAKALKIPPSTIYTIMDRKKKKSEKEVAEYALNPAPKKPTINQEFEDALPKVPVKISNRAEETDAILDRASKSDILLHIAQIEHELGKAISDQNVDFHKMLEYVKQDIGQQLNDYNSTLQNIDHRLGALTRTVTGHITGGTNAIDVNRFAKFVASVLKELGVA